MESDWKEIDLLIRSLKESIESDLGNRPEDDPENTYTEDSA